MFVSLIIWHIAFKSWCATQDLKTIIHLCQNRFLSFHFTLDTINCIIVLLYYCIVLIVINYYVPVIALTELIQVD